jgi:hypothetical protein
MELFSIRDGTILDSSKSPLNTAVSRLPAPAGLTAMRRRKKFS